MAHNLIHISAFQKFKPVVAETFPGIIKASEIYCLKTINAYKILRHSAKELLRNFNLSSKRWTEGAAD